VDEGHGVNHLNRTCCRHRLLNVACRGGGWWVVQCACWGQRELQGTALDPAAVEAICQPWRGHVASRQLCCAMQACVGSQAASLHPTVLATRQELYPPPTSWHAARHRAGRTRLPPASREYLRRHTSRHTQLCWHLRGDADWCHSSSHAGACFPLCGCTHAVRQCSAPSLLSSLPRTGPLTSLTRSESQGT
jgi:hypothetical protein